MTATATTTTPSDLLRIAEYHLAVDDTTFRKRGRERLDELRKVPVHRLLIATLQQDLVAIPKDERAESVPLRFELPSLAFRQRFRGVRQHRSERRHDRQFHARMLPAERFLHASTPQEDEVCWETDTPSRRSP